MSGSIFFYHFQPTWSIISAHSVQIARCHGLSAFTHAALIFRLMLSWRRSIVIKRAPVSAEVRVLDMNAAWSGGLRLAF